MERDQTPIGFHLVAEEADIGKIVSYIPYISGRFFRIHRFNKTQGFNAR